MHRVLDNSSTTQVKLPPAFRVLLLLLLAAPAALAQSASELLLSPAASQPSALCGKYVTMQNTQNGLCGLSVESAVFAAGNGTKTMVIVTNPTKNPVTINLGFNPSGGMTENYGNCLVYVSTYGGTPVSADGLFSTILPGTSLMLALVYPGEITSSLDTLPLPDQLVMGSLTMGIYGPDGPSIDALIVSETIVFQKDNQPVQMTVPVLPESETAPFWKFDFPRVSLAKSTPLTDDVTLSVQNTSSTPQSVLVSVTSSGVTASFTTPLLEVNALYESTATDAFPQITAAEIAGGTITFEALANEPIIASLLQAKTTTPPAIRYSIHDPRRRSPGW